MDQSQKHRIAELVRKAVKTAGSQKSFASKHGISATTINFVIKGNWSLVSDKMWQRLAAATQFIGTSWQCATTANYKAMQQACRLAQADGLSLAISHDAGAGKSYALQMYAANTANAFYVQCETHWTRTQFFTTLYRAIGKDPRGLSTAELAEEIIIELRTRTNPLLILDEADKLRDVCLLYYITLYNQLDGICGFILCGTPHLRHAWESGARRDRRGYKEVHSRIGRRFIELRRIGRPDVEAICKANGVADEGDINAIWNEVQADPDLRRVRREVEKLTKHNPAKAA